MREPLYRYFLAFRPDPGTCRALAQIAKAAGQGARRVQEHLLHLTLCAVGEAREPNPFIQRQVRAALAGHALPSVAIALGRVRSGRCATARTVGRQDAIQDFYRTLARLLRLHGIEPLARTSGLHPHVTLGYDACDFASFDIALEWLAGELLLIESHHGFTRHAVIDRWPLLPPRQPLLPFGRRPALRAAELMRRDPRGGGRSPAGTAARPPAS